MFGRKAKPTVKISMETQNGVCRYLMQEYKARLASPDPGSRASAEAIRRAFTEFIIDINKPEPAIRILKEIRKGTQQAFPRLGPEDTAAAVCEIFLVEVMLKDLGVTDFEP